MNGEKLSIDQVLKYMGDILYSPNSDIKLNEDSGHKFAEIQFSLIKGKLNPKEAFFKMWQIMNNDYKR
jgi:hypothetical protein